MPLQHIRATTVDRDDSPTLDHCWHVVIGRVTARKHGAAKSSVSTSINAASQYLTGLIGHENGTEHTISNSRTGITKAHQTLQHSITEHMYAAQRQQERTGLSSGKPTSLDWIDAA